MRERCPSIAYTTTDKQNTDKIRSICTMCEKVVYGFLDFNPSQPIQVYIFVIKWRTMSSAGSFSISCHCALRSLYYIL